MSKIVTHPRIFALATDTIWGLGCVAEDSEAVAEIFLLKGRDFSKPLVLFVADIDQAAEIQYIPPALRSWLQKEWPGPLTFVSHAASDRYGHCHPGNDYIGIRIPDHQTPQELLRLYQKPLAVTSLNLSNEAPVEHPKYLDGILAEKIEAVFGESCPGPGLPSAVIKYDGEGLSVLRGDPEQICRLRHSLPEGFLL